MPDKFEQITEKEVHVLDKADRVIVPEDALVDALNLLTHLESQKDDLESREEMKEQLTIGQRWADKIAEFGGSWTFLISFGVLIFVWMCLNIYQLTRPWDPYPFILLNLVLSTLAAVQAPIIMMSQNRQTQRDRYRDEIDFERDRLDLKVDTLAAKTIREATVRIASIEKELKMLNEKLGTKKKRR